MVPTTEFLILYQSPYKWRCEESLGELITKVSVCDGKTAWAYSIENSLVSDIKRWDVEAAVKRFGTKLTLERLMIGDNRVIVYALANPIHFLWRDEFAFPIYDFSFARIKEEQIDQTPCVVYESGHHLKIALWFGMEDGLLRKEVIFDDDFQSSEIVVEKVKFNPKLRDETFRFTPPSGAAILDKTDDLFKDIVEQRDLYKRLAEKSGKRVP